MVVRTPSRRFSHPLRSTTRSRATAIGLAAILFWSAMAALIRLVSDSFGPTRGMALLYSLTSVLLWVFRRPRGLRTFPPRYLLIGGALFLTTEIGVGLGVGLAADANQAIEVSIVNYLWPTGTVLLSALALHRQPFWSVLPGSIIATAGIVLAVGGDAGLDPTRIAERIEHDPLPYGLALLAALAWSCYNVLSPRLSRGYDGITLFFTGVTGALWIVDAIGGAPVPTSPSWIGILALGAGAITVAAGYSFWNIGILHGDLRVLSIGSYTAPILSSAVAALLLGTALSAPFWAGVALVTAGSLLGWRAGEKAPDAASRSAIGSASTIMEESTDSRQD